MRTWIAVSLFMGLAATAFCQVTITPADMFTTIGFYYRSYSTAAAVDVTGIAGSSGGPQTWNFIDGPTDNILRTDIVDPADGGFGGNFPQAQWCERQGVENQDPAVRWYYRLDPTGIVNLGAWSPFISEQEPVLPFNPPVLEYPDPLDYGDNWNSSTEVYTTILYEGTPLDVKIELTSNSQADAWGTLLLPTTAGSSLRIDRQIRYDIYTEIWGFWILLDSYFMRSYQWLLANRGIAAQLISDEATSAPPENFTLANFVRQIETNHPGGTPDPVIDLTAVFSMAGIQLDWSDAAGAACYRVECCADPDFSTEITELALAYDSEFLDSSYSGHSARFYRVVSLN